MLARHACDEMSVRCERHGVAAFASKRRRPNAAAPRVALRVVVAARRKEAANAALGFGTRMTDQHLRAETKAAEERTESTENVL